MSHPKWPMVPLGELLTKNESIAEILAGQKYQEVTIRLWGKGVVRRQYVDGENLLEARRFQVTSGQFILSRIDARNGAMGVVPDELDNAIVTNDFPSYNVYEDRLLPSFMGWLCRTKGFVDLCRSASEGTTNRVRLKELRFLQMKIALPPVDEQSRICRKVDAIVSKLAEANELESASDCSATALLRSRHNQLAKHAPRKRLDDVAPLERRPAQIDPNRNYPQVSVRSFGRGTFHSGTLVGAEITWQKPYLVKSGDILMSNIKAWEGAIAVAQPEDDDRFGSHRYLTFRPKENVATPEFLTFHLLSPEGLARVGEASPGSADRNRTTSSRKVAEIEVPVPDFQDQQRFSDLIASVNSIKKVREETVTRREAMMPSILDRAFKGEL